MDWSKIVGVIKLSPKHYFSIVLLLGFLLFTPCTYLQIIGLLEFSTQYKPIIAILFLLFLILLLVNFGISIFSFAKSKYAENKRTRKCQLRLHNLTGEEKEILLGYLDKDTRTQPFNISDGVIQGLFAEGILYRPSVVSIEHTYWAYNIQPWAWDYLKKHRHEIFQK